MEPITRTKLSASSLLQNVPQLFSKGMFDDYESFTQVLLTNVHNPDFGELCSRLISYIESSPYRSEITRHITQATTYIRDTFSTNCGVIQNLRLSRKEELMEAFERYVRQNFRQQRNLAFYADKLCITKRYLSEVIKQASGKTASQWIDRFVIEEAKSLLCMTNLTVTQIGYELNFSNPSFFGKYFKRHTGLTPKEYIRSISASGKNID